MVDFYQNRIRRTGCHLSYFFWLLSAGDPKHSPKRNEKESLYKNFGTGKKKPKSS